MKESNVGRGRFHSLYTNAGFSTVLIKVKTNTATRVNLSAPGWLCQQSITVQVETGEGVEGARYHGNARDAAVPILHQAKQLHHTETWSQMAEI